jgi:hypothetical protein
MCGLKDSKFSTEVGRPNRKGQGNKPALERRVEKVNGELNHPFEKEKYREGYNLNYVTYVERLYV